MKKNGSNVILFKKKKRFFDASKKILKMYPEYESRKKLPLLGQFQ